MEAYDAVSFDEMYDVLRGLSVIEDLVYSPHCRAWFIHGFVLKTSENDTCAHSHRCLECVICGGANVIQPCHIFAIKNNLGAAVNEREILAQGRIGIDGLPIVVEEYEPYTPATMLALQNAEMKCLDIWRSFVTTVMHAIVSQNNS